MKMKIGLILMSCKECGSIETKFDEILGEVCCSSCGLVVITEMFEETVRIINAEEPSHSKDKQLGSIIKGKGAYKFNRFHRNNVISQRIMNGINLCNMILANTPFIALKDRAQEVYLHLNNNGVFSSGFTYEARATAVVYFVLLENNTPHLLKELTSEFPETTKSAHKLIKKIKKHYKFVEVKNNQYVLSKTISSLDVPLSFYKNAEETLNFFDSLIKEHNITQPTHYCASICLITANLFNYTEISNIFISKKLGISRNLLRRDTKKLLSLIGFRLVREIKGKKLW